MSLRKIDNLIVEIKKTKKLNVNDWDEFLLLNLFPEYDRGQRLKKSDRILGELPLITAGQFNNGIAEYVKKTKTNKLFRDSITIDMFGNCFYQEGEFICDDNIIVIKNIKNKYVGLFLASVINRYVNFDFKKQFRIKHLDKVKIKLPVDKKGEPDWKFMEDYIKKLQKKIELSLN